MESARTPRVARTWLRLLLYAGAVFAAIIVANILFLIALAASGTFQTVATAEDVGAALEAVPPALMAASNALTFGLLLATTLLFWRVIDRQPLAALRIGSSRRAGLLVAMGGLLGGALVLAPFTAAALFGLARFDGLRDAPWSDHLTELAVQFAVLAIAAAAEEVMFRGYLLRNMEKAAGPGAAILVTSALFSLFHLTNPNIAGSLALPNIFLIGVVFAIACRRWNSLWLPFGLHLGWNFTQGPILAIPVSGADLFPGLFATDWPAAETLWSGGAFGLEGGLLCTIAVALLLGLLALTGRRSAAGPA